MKKYFALVLAVMVICSCGAYSCSSSKDNSKAQSSQGAIHKTYKQINIENPKVTTGIEISDIKGDIENFDKLTEEEQDFFKQYLKEWGDVIVSLNDDELSLDNYKTDFLNNSFDQLSDISKKYQKSSFEILEVVVDFFALAGIDAKYALVLNFETHFGDNIETLFVKDDTYAQYVYDLSFIYNRLCETYFPDDFETE